MFDAIAREYSELYIRFMHFNRHEGFVLAQKRPAVLDACLPLSDRRYSPIISLLLFHSNYYLQ